MDINLVALVVTSLVPMTLGFIWYHPKVFGTMWMHHAGMTDEKIKSGNMALIYGLSFLFSLMLSWIMNLIAYHDAFVGGAMFYATNGTMQAETGSELAKWMEYYTNNLSAAHRTFKHGAFHGLMIAGLFIALPVLATNALFERKSFKYVAVNAGYWILCLSLMAGIIAAWK